MIVLEQMDLAVLEIADALRAVSEGHIGIGKIRLSADGALVSCHLH